jgi:hypothetical protein
MTKKDTTTTTARRKKAIVMIAAIAAIGVITSIALGESSSRMAAAPGFALADSSGTTATETHFQQGTATSIADPLPGHHMHQLIMILPPRDDSKVYSGILTFAASKKVEVVVLHAMSNDTKIPVKFGQPLSAIVPPDNKTMVGISLITPDYGSTPAPSYSIPFAGNALALHTLSGEPFAASYTVSYQVGKPTIVNNIGSSQNSSNASNGTSQ